MIKVNVTKAKVIAHDISKADRAEKMAPLDVEATIPMFSESASATDEVELKEALAAL